MDTDRIDRAAEQHKVSINESRIKMRSSSQYTSLKEEAYLDSALGDGRNLPVREAVDVRHVGGGNGALSEEGQIFLTLG